MTQITEIDDPRIVKGLAHPLRIHILRVLQERVASPSEIAAGSDASLGTISYHVRYLERVGLIELTSTKARRGAVEHYYRAVGRLRITDNAWAQLPGAVRESLIGSTLDQIGRVVTEAAAEGGFTRDDTHVTRNRFTLDDEGFRELSVALGELVDQALEIERHSVRRLAEAHHSKEEIASTMVAMLFDNATSLPTAVQDEGSEAAELQA
ncbi:MAG TPA: helix-turn-helix domain-containing protein [Solirubrobacteraceae bacterium]